MAEPNRFDIPLISTVGFVSVVATVVAIVGVQALFYRYQNVQYQQKIVLVRDQRSESQAAAEQARLSAYGWIDRGQGRVVIPIQRAMSLMVQEQRSVATKSGQVSQPFAGAAESTKSGQSGRSRPEGQ